MTCCLVEWDPVPGRPRLCDMLAEEIADTPYAS